MSWRKRKFILSVLPDLQTITVCLSISSPAQIFISLFSSSCPGESCLVTWRFWKGFTYLNVALIFCVLPIKWSILPQDNLMACRLMKFLGIEWTWIRRKSSLLQWMCCFEIFPVNCMFLNEGLLTAAVNFFPNVLDVSYSLSVFLKASRRRGSCLFMSVTNSSFLDWFGRRNLIWATLFS